MKPGVPGIEYVSVEDGVGLTFKPYGLSVVVGARVVLEIPWDLILEAYRKFQRKEK